MCKLCAEVSPPPPPSADKSIYAEVMENDPIGYQNLLAKMEQWCARVRHAIARCTHAPTLPCERSRRYPMLDLTATTSVGSSIGDYPPEQGMNKYELTRAFLATRGLEPESLAARMIGARHTRRWRYACKELVNYMRDEANAAAGSDGVGLGIGETAGFSGKYDRNILMYWTLAYKQSYEKYFPGLVDFDSYELYEELCSVACSYRVPVDASVKQGADVYSEKPSYNSAGVRCNELGPIVATGSLRQLRDEAMGGDCNNQYPEDHVGSLYCDGTEYFRAGSMFINDMKARFAYAPGTYKRTVMCDPYVDLSIQDVIGNPKVPSGGLYDSTEASSAGLNDLVVLPQERGMSDFSREYRQKSMMTMVYVTSSHEKAYPPGVYYMKDLGLFRDEGCASMAHAYCGYRGSNPDVAPGRRIKSGMPQFYDIEGTDFQDTKMQSLRNFQNALLGPMFSVFGIQGLPSDVFQFSSVGLGRRLKEMTGANDSFIEATMERYRSEFHRRNLAAVNVAGYYRVNMWDVVINRYQDIDYNAQTYDSSETTWLSGGAMLLKTRCSDYLQNTWNINPDNPQVANPCIRSPYTGNVGTNGVVCYQGDLILKSEPDFGPASEFIHRFYIPPPPPPPRPPPSPPPPRSPPPPGLPPYPPPVFSIGEIRSQARDIEERFCDSVYWLSSRARCDQLAIDLQVQYRLPHYDPPSLPPIAPNDPSPPASPSPPPPLTPPGETIVYIVHALLSTQYRLKHDPHPPPPPYPAPPPSPPPIPPGSPPPPSPEPPPGYPARPPYPPATPVDPCKDFVDTTDTGTGCDDLTNGFYSASTSSLLCSLFTFRNNCPYSCCSLDLSGGRRLSQPTVRYGSYSEYLTAMLLLQLHNVEQRSRCTQALQDAPLPCATGVTDSTCMDGTRPCSHAELADDRAVENGLAPELMLDMDAPSWKRGKYIHKFLLHVPHDDHEYGPLLHSSLYSGDGGGGVGYQILLYDAAGHLLQKQCRGDASQVLRSFVAGLYTYEHFCLEADATNEDVWTIAQARYVRLLLNGMWRQVWLQNLDVVERDLDAVSNGTFYAPPPSASPSPPPYKTPPPGAPPAQPSAPPSPETPPPGVGMGTVGGLYGCNFFENKYYAESTYTVPAQDEPCLTTPQQCCYALIENRAVDPLLNAYTIGPTGCCELLRVDSVAEYPTTIRAPAGYEKYENGAAGTGLIVG